MSEIFIVAGFLGAGKTTVINGLLKGNQKSILLIENEVGNRSIDGDYLGRNNVSVQNLLSGCICCSLAADFQQVVQANQHFDRIIIEPTGVAQLSTLLEALKQFGQLYAITVVDADELLESVDYFGDFFTDQIINADTLILNYRNPQHVEQAADTLREMNPEAQLYVRNLAEESLCIEDIRYARQQITQTFNHIDQELAMDTLVIENADFDSFAALQETLTRQFETQVIYRVKGHSVINHQNYQVDYAAGQWQYQETPGDSHDLVIIFQAEPHHH